jgi:dihydroxyacid dehydratase/phosphogluconate dehydratase
MNKPQVGIASMWYEGNPCNMHLLNLAEEVKRGVVSVLLLGVKYSILKQKQLRGWGCRALNWTTAYPAEEV